MKPKFKITNKKNLYKGFFELNKISNFQNNREVINWCKKKCQKLDIQIEEDALKELVDLKNNNLRALVNELNKLHAYSDGKKIYNTFTSYSNR